MGRDTVQLETAVSTISQEYLLEFTSEYCISEDLYPKLPGPGERILDFLIGEDEMPAENTYSREAVLVLNTHCTPIQKQPKALLLLVGLSRRYLLGDEVCPTFLHDDDRGGAPNPTKVKTGTRLRATHEVPILTVTSSRVIELTEDRGHEAVAPEVPPPENVTTTKFAPEAGQVERIAATGPRVIKERRNRGNDGFDTNAPPKVLRRDHADSRPTQSTIGGKSLTAMALGMGSTCPVPTSWDTHVDVSDPDPLSFTDPQSLPTAKVAQSFKGAAVAGDLESENTSFTSMVGSPESIYRPEWGVTNGCLLDALKACQDLQVAMGSQLRLRFEQEAKLLKKSVALVARQDKRIQARENEIKNLETLLEAETDMKKTAEVKNVKLSNELENLRALFSYLQVSNDRLSQQVSTLQTQRCVEMDARLDALSIDFDEELYPHMLTAIIGHRWVIRHGLRLAVMKCDESIELRQVFADVVSAGIAKGMNEGLKYGVEHGKANLSLEAIEAYDPEAKAKYITALHALKDLKYPMVDQLESLKDAPIDVKNGLLTPGE
nr:hypothetical protein [Tanacetum cinerariifolium]